MSDRYEGEYQNEPEDWYPETDDDDNLIAEGIYVAGDGGDPADHPPTLAEDPSFYGPEQAKSARALGEEMKVRLTNDDDPPIDYISGHHDTPEGSVYIPSEAELAAQAAKVLLERTGKREPVLMDDDAAMPETTVRLPIHYGSSGPAYAVDALKADLIALLSYNWRTEEADYYRSLVEEDDTLGVMNTHIFPVMQRLNVWVTGL